MNTAKMALTACSALLLAAAPAVCKPLTAQILDKIDPPSASLGGGQISELSGLAWGGGEKPL
jgi:hypothetical protein